jgi:hypothetical protein
MYSLRVEGMPCGAREQQIPVLFFILIVAIVSLLVLFLVNSERPPDWPSASHRRLFARTRVPSTKSGVAPRAASRKARAAGGREVARWRSAGTLYVAPPWHETDALWSLPRRFPKLVLFP